MNAYAIAALVALITATIGIGPRSEGGFGITAALDVYLPGLPEAVRWSFDRAEPGDAVLLSPACASLDMFRNYAHRAEVFADAVQRLAADRGEMLA